MISIDSKLPSLSNNAYALFLPYNNELISNLAKSSSPVPIYKLIR